LQSDYNFKYSTGFNKEIQPAGENQHQQG